MLMILKEILRFKTVSYNILNSVFHKRTLLNDCEDNWKDKPGIV